MLAMSARHCSNRQALRKVRWQVCDLWQLRSTNDDCSCLRRVQLRLLPGPLRHLRRTRRVRRFLLQRVHTTRKRCELARSASQAWWTSERYPSHTWTVR